MNKKKLEKQLAKPKGKNGIKLGDKMYHGNLSMIKSSIKQLDIQDNDTVLEIGHGNGKHIPLLLTKALDIKYSGLEISETMKEEASKYCSAISADHACNFACYNGYEIPYKANSFDRIFSVNTIYFWKNPLSFLKEIHRVLKVKGILVITFAEKKFMEQLPFVNDRFTLYDKETFQALISQTYFEICNSHYKKELVENKSGIMVMRTYFSFQLKK